MAPRISILMPVYNTEAYVAEAIESILTQSFSDFEFLIINDGSTDGSGKVLDAYAERDERIRVYHEKNQGISASLNKGLAKARGEFIARMDSDDVALAGKLERQVAFLDAHPEIGIVSGGCNQMTPEGRVFETNLMPTDDLEIRWMLLLRSPFAHVTVMIRRSILETHDLHYDPAWEAVEDYELWTRLMKHTRGANLPEPLVNVRMHPSSVCSRRRDVQLQNHNKIAFRTIREQLPDLSITEDEVREWGRVYLRGGAPLADRDPRRVTLARSYFRLMQAFAGRHRGEPELQELLAREARGMLSVLSEVPARVDLLLLLIRLLCVNPRLAAFLGLGVRRRVQRLVGSGR